MSSERLVFWIFLFLSKVSLLIKTWILWWETIQQELVFLLNLQILNLQMRHTALILNVFLPMDNFYFWLPSFFEDWVFIVANPSVSFPIHDEIVGSFPHILLFLCLWKKSCFLYIFQAVSPSPSNKLVINDCCFCKIDNKQMLTNVQLLI